MGRNVQHIVGSEPASFATWRRRALVAAGFDPELAAGLARDPRVDLHALLELVDAGCPPGLASRILAPLEADPQIRA